MKEKISNKIELKDKRQRLRIALTPQELMLWSKLKKRNLGYKFRRQHSFGSYIADFYRREKSLIVEIDGSEHMDKRDTISNGRNFLKVMDFEWYDSGTMRSIPMWR